MLCDPMARKARRNDSAQIKPSGSLKAELFHHDRSVTRPRPLNKQCFTATRPSSGHFLTTIARPIQKSLRTKQYACTYRVENQSPSAILAHEASPYLSSPPCFLLSAPFMSHETSFADSDQALHLLFIIFIMLFLIFFPSIQKQRFKQKSITVDQPSWGDRINHWGSKRKPGC